MDVDDADNADADDGSGDGDSLALRCAAAVANRAFCSATSARNCWISSLDASGDRTAEVEDEDASWRIGDEEEASGNAAEGRDDADDSDAKAVAPSYCFGGVSLCPSC